MKPLIILLLILSPISSKARFEDISWQQPSHKVGSLLWKAPVGGKTFLNVDATKILVAQISAGRYYLVDASNGEVDTLSFFLSSKNPSSRAIASSDLRWLAVHDVLDSTLTVFDTGADTVVSRLPVVIDFYPSEPAVSFEHDLVSTNEALIRVSTGDTVLSYSTVGWSWFDDERAQVFLSAGRKTMQYNITTMTLIAEHTTILSNPRMYRPPNTTWLYLFGTEPNKRSPNQVIPYNLESQELVQYISLFDTNENLPTIDAYTTYIGHSGEDAVLSSKYEFGRSRIWTFSGSPKRYQVILDEDYQPVIDESDVFSMIDRDIERYFVSGNTGSVWQDSLFCYKLELREPVSVYLELQKRVDNQCTLTDAPATVYNVLGEVVATVEIISGAIAHHQLDALPEQPLWAVQDGGCVKRVR